MDVLSKHKKLGIQGLKNFVIYLEQADPKRYEEIILQAKLEDPVYAQYLECNIVRFDYFLNTLTVDDFVKIHDSLPSGPSTFTFAFKDSPEREVLTQKLPILMERKIGFAEEKIPGVTPRQRLEARNILLKKMRELELTHEVSKFNWKLPSESVARGEHFLIPISGRFFLKFENGKMALEGQYLDKLRTGAWKHYSPEGPLFAQGSYIKGEKIGKWSFYYPSGAISCEGNYVEDLRSGEWKIYSPEGKVSTIKYERGRPI